MDNFNKKYFSLLPYILGYSFYISFFGRVDLFYFKQINFLTSLGFLIKPCVFIKNLTLRGFYNGFIQINSNYTFSFLNFSQQLLSRGFITLRVKKNNFFINVLNFDKRKTIFFLNKGLIGFKSKKKKKYFVSVKTLIRVTVIFLNIRKRLYITKIFPKLKEYFCFFQNFGFFYFQKIFYYNLILIGSFRNRELKFAYKFFLKRSKFHRRFLKNFKLNLFSGEKFLDKRGISSFFFYKKKRIKNKSKFFYVKRIVPYFAFSRNVRRFGVSVRNIKSFVLGFVSFAQFVRKFSFVNDESFDFFLNMFRFLRLKKKFFFFTKRRFKFNTKFFLLRSVFFKRLCYIRFLVKSVLSRVLRLKNLKFFNIKYKKYGFNLINEIVLLLKRISVGFTSLTVLFQKLFVDFKEFMLLKGILKRSLISNLLYFKVLGFDYVFKDFYLKFNKNVIFKNLLVQNILGVDFKITFFRRLVYFTFGLFYVSVKSFCFKFRFKFINNYIFFLFFSFFRFDFSYLWGCTNFFFSCKLL